MEIIKNYKLSENDIELLKNILPDNPCCDCYIGSACCGCPEGGKYERQVKPYKEAGIYEIALNIKKSRMIKRIIKAREEELEALINSIPQEVREFC